MKAAEMIDLLIEQYVVAFNMLLNVDYLSNTSLGNLKVSRELLLVNIKKALVNLSLQNAEHLETQILPIRIDEPMVKKILNVN